MDVENVVKLVADALKKRPDPRLNTELLVLAEGIQQRGEWWYVPVYPVDDSNGVPYDYYNALAMAMEELDESGVKIQLIPASASEAVH